MLFSPIIFLTLHLHSSYFALQPPVLDPSKSKVDGLAFLGLSLSQFSDQGHPESANAQTAFDLNEVIDREVSFC